MWLVGALLGLLAIGLIVGNSLQKKRAYLIQSTETTNAKTLLEEASDVAKEIGAGSFNKVTEVKGECVCSHPLTSELAERACVYYSMKVTREYEEEYWDTDSNGHRVRRTRRGSETVAGNKNSTPFYVQDSSGKVRVDPTGASFVAEKVLSRFEPRESVESGRFRMGAFLLNAAVSAASGRRTLGYKYEEEIIPVGRQLYILGEAVDQSGEVTVAKPADKKNQFIVSVKSEEELLRSAKSAAQWCLAGAVVSALAGAAFFIMYFALHIDFFA